MAWWTIHRASDGELLGHTSIEPIAPPAGTTVVQHADRMDQANLWDAASRTWGVRPPPVVMDRLADLAAHPYAAELWSRLTAAQRPKLRKLLVWLLATHRYRSPLEPVALDADDAWPTDPSVVVE